MISSLRAARLAFSGLFPYSSVFLFGCLWILGACQKKPETAFPRLSLPAGSQFRLIQPVVAPPKDSKTKSEVYNGILYAIGSPSPGTDFVVGAQSIVWKVSEGKGQAVRVPLPISGELYGIAFPAPSTGFIVGNNGLILRTDDGGAVWKTVPSPVRDAFLQTVSFPSGRIGYIAGERGTLLKSEDGGTTWKALPKPADENLYSVYFRDDENGWVAGWGKTFLRTRDGGQSFRPVALSVPKVGRKDPSFNAVWGRGETVYLAGDHGLLYRSTDGGRTFSRIDLPTDSDFYAGCAEGSDYAVVGGEGGTLYAIGPGNAIKPLLTGFPWADFLGLSCGQRHVRVVGVPSVVLVPRTSATSSRP
jgi:photosystem II stability/assembly factor-like uncharacterized protein